MTGPWQIAAALFQELSEPGGGEQVRGDTLDSINTAEAILREKSVFFIFP